jgi:hypothetical protein
MHGIGDDSDSLFNSKLISLINSDGKIAYISGPLFYQLCIVKDHCFLCLERKGDSERNREHVIPNWFLNFRGLQNRYIQSTSGEKHMYAKHTIDCCNSCNSYLADVFEKKISEVIKSQRPEISKDLLEDDYVFLYQWLCLIQLKFFIYDAKRGLASKGRPSSYLSNLSLWEGVSHIVNVARSRFAGVEIDPDSVGSVFVTTCAHEDDNANIIVLEEPRAMMLRAGKYALISVPCDGSYGAKLHRDFIRNIREKLTGIQLMELLCRYAAANACMPFSINHTTALNGVISLTEKISIIPPAYDELRRKYGALMATIFSQYGLFEAFDDINYLDVKSGNYSSFPHANQRFLPKQK